MEFWRGRVGRARLCRAAQLAQFRPLTLALPSDLEVGFWDFGVTGTDAKYDRDRLGLRSKTSLNRYRPAARCLFFEVEIERGPQFGTRAK
jgi:hypothetical protein